VALRTLRRNPLPLFVAASSALLCAVAVASGGPAQLLGVLPAILIVVLLACDRYPGEEAIRRLAERYRPGRRVSAASSPPSGRWTELSASRRLLLLATCRTLRGPPAPLAL